MSDNKLFYTSAVQVVLLKKFFDNIKTRVPIAANIVSIIESKGGAWEEMFTLGLDGLIEFDKVSNNQIKQICIYDPDLCEDDEDDVTLDILGDGRIRSIGLSQFNSLDELVEEFLKD